MTKSNRSRVLNKLAPFDLPCLGWRPLLIGASFCAIATLAPSIPTSADETIGAGEDASYGGGLLCFRSHSEAGTMVHLVRYDHGRIKPLFAKATHTVNYPI